MLPTLTTRECASSFDSIRSEMDDAFRELFGHFGTSNKSRCRSAGSFLTVWEDDSTIFVEADVPGFGKDDLEVTIHEGILWIRGERRLPEREGTIRHNERSFGKLERAISLPDTIDTENVDAAVENGVLKLQVAKRESEQTKRIEIK